MPQRNVIKIDAPDQYYHVYSRGANKQPIFRDDADYRFFMSLFSRSLSIEPQASRLTRYPHLRGELELIAFCLMPNHVHLLIYQRQAGSMQQLMRSMMTSYSMYFNRKYARTGPLFESRYKASRIDHEAYLLHISRYIHLNPRSYKRYPYSSFRTYIGGSMPEWLEPQRALELFGTPQAYENFVADYEDVKRTKDLVKKELAI